VVNAETGATTLEGGSLYVAGAVWDIAGAELTVPVSGVAVVGAYMTTTVVTAREDPGLRDPAIGVENYQEPGAARLRIDLAWGLSGQAGSFYPVHTIVNGVLQTTKPPPQMDTVSVALARYDREANGHYVVDGFGVTFLSHDTAAGDYIYSLGHGTCNVSGWKVERTIDARLRFPVDPELKAITAEPHVFADAGNGTMRVDTNLAPIHAITEITVTKSKTVSMTHGVYGGCTDTLPDAAVVQVLEVKQGGVTYAAGSDYTVAGDNINWAPGGVEPAPGSTYTVTYWYVDTVAPTAVDDDGFTVGGVVEGTTFNVSYSWAMPRIDIITIDAKGQTARVTGLPRSQSPVAPSAPSGTLVLAEIHLDWRRDSAPVVRNSGVRVTRMDELEAMRAQISELYDLAALQSLRTDVATRETGVKKGIFIDPFRGNDMRDTGIAQTGAIAKEMLTLPVRVDAVQLPSDPMAGTYMALTGTLTPVLEQPRRTGEMKVNPYMAFAALPATVTLQPAVDEWATLDTVWDAATQVFVGSGDQSSSTTSEELVSRTSEASASLRPISISYTLSGFDPGETLAGLAFDTVVLTPNPGPIANSAGVVTGSFDIPSGLPTGTKQVLFLGNQGSFGIGTFAGGGTVTTERRRKVTTTTYWQSASSYDGGGSSSYDGGGSDGGSSDGGGSTGPGGPPGGPGASPPGTPGGPPGGPGVLWEMFHTHDPNDPIIEVLINCWDDPSGRPDPLAQTFTLAETRVVEAVELWFTAKGTGDVIVQLRETSNGVPGSIAVSEGRISASSIVLGGAPTRVAVASCVLFADREYALVVMTDDATHALSIAQTGKYDAAAGQWITAQPYQIGVMLSSSNAITWTAHQDMDLAFRLLGTVYAATSREITLGTFNVTNASDLLVLGAVDRPATTTDAKFLLVSGSDIHELTEGTALNLPARVTGPVTLKAKLTGDTRLSPVVYPSPKLVVGNLAETGDYISRAFPAAASFSITVVLESKLPTGSTLAVYAESGTSGNWVAVPFSSGAPVGNGWDERTFKADGLTGVDAGHTTRVKLVLTGTPAARPFVRALRAISL
jgi:uncharacterized membrane protein YgcG